MAAQHAGRKPKAGKAERAYERFARRFRLTPADRVAYLAGAAGLGRGPLLAGTALATSLYVFQPAPAQAQVLVTGNDVSTAATTLTITSDTTFPTTAPTDRHYAFGAGGAVTSTLDGAVAGAGFAITNTQAGAAGNITVTNNAGVTLSNGTTAAQGGNAAFNINAAGGTVT